MAASCSGSCAASFRSGCGASGAGPTRKKRSRSPASRRLRGLELSELGVLVGEKRSCLQFEQRSDQDEELAAGLEVELLPFGEVLDERDDDRCHIHVGGLQLLLQEQREQQIEGTLERIEVQLEFADDNHGLVGG